MRLHWCSREFLVVAVGITLWIGSPRPARADRVAVIQPGMVVLLETFATGLGGELYGSPLDLAPLPDGTGRIAIATYRGVIRLVDEGGAYLDTEESPFLATDSLFGLAAAGFTTLAFHPDYAKPGSRGYGKLYTIITAITDLSLVDFPGKGLDAGQPHDAILREYSADDPTSNSPNFGQRDVIRFHERQGAHNITDIVFDDAGLLYIPAGDSQNPTSAQDEADFLGTIFRVDPLNPIGLSDGALSALGLVRSDNGKYSNPTSNPNFGIPAELDEIFAYGVRSPFRVSIDRGAADGEGAGDVYLGDVGNSTREEISIIESGGNYGWPDREGTLGTYPIGDNNVDPIFELNHKLTLNEHGLIRGGSAIIGGFVYRGEAVPELQGKYVFGELGREISQSQQGNAPRIFYGDVESGEIFEFGIDPAGQELAGRVVLSIGEDQDAELYVLLGDDPGNQLGTGGIVVKLPEPPAATLTLASLLTLALLGTYRSSPRCWKARIGQAGSRAFESRY